jgi:transcriptional regulator with XRE-family HTH domain
VKTVSASREQAERVDAQIGSRIRLMRALVGISQEKLGHLLGLTFQQIQKYEKGTNRISAGRLSEVARVLSVPISSFYEGLSEHTSDTPTNISLMQSLSGQELQLSLAFARIKDATLRKHLLGLVETLAVSAPETICTPK